MIYYALFFFAALGSKLLLAVLTIYLLFPSHLTCDECDGETLLLQMGRSGRLLSRLTLGRLQRRWCPRCGWEGLARRPRSVIPTATGATAGLEGSPAGEQTFRRRRSA